MNHSASGKTADSIIIPREFVLDQELEAAWNVMEHTSDTVFLTGRAGTGKSTLLNYFRKTTSKKYVVLAPTGLAALQVGGNTIHSFFGFPLRTMVKNDPDIRAWGKGHARLRILKKMDVLIIDEVSMVRADVMDAIDQALRINMNVSLPFGGKQLIVIGDVFQLPPVVTASDSAYEEDSPYNDPYFFSAEVFRSDRPKIIELKKIYRQQDDDFIYLLNRIRMGIAREDDLAELNKCFLPDDDADNDFAITLTSINAIADNVNQQRLLNLGALSFMYKSKAEGVFDERLYPAPAILKLKVGAQVMMVKNDLHGRWVNGSIGIVEKLGEREVIIRFQDGSTSNVDPVTWENKSYSWDKQTNTITFAVKGTFTQYPIRLAWAITIHKSQGLTFEKVIIDIGRGAFAHGQLYVALSRCKTLTGIKLRTRIRMQDMIVDEAVEHFAGKAGIG
jgi:ATP-dependent DNA helicase PIF1